MKKQPMKKRQCLLTASGAYLPSNAVSNDDLAKRMDTSDEWIRQRTGIAKRHIVAKDEQTSDLGVKAGKEALKKAGLKAEDLDCIIVATTTPDRTFPATACQVQADLGASKAFAFDVQAVCAGFIYGLDIADGLISSGKADRILLIGAESFTHLLDWEDRSTAVLFGDGAGAVVLEASDEADDWGILASRLYSDGRLADILYVDGGVSSTQTVGHVRMEGKEVFRHAVDKLSSSMVEVMEEAGLSIAEIDWYIPHQANLRIIDGIQRKLGLDKDKVILTVSEHANTSAASIPLALDKALSDGVIKDGDILAMQAIGGGLSWGSAIVRYGRG